MQKKNFRREKKKIEKKKKINEKVHLIADIFPFCKLTNKKVESKSW